MSAPNQPSFESLREILADMKAKEEEHLKELGDRHFYMHPFAKLRVFPDGVPDYLKDRIHVSNSCPPDKCYVADMSPNPCALRNE